MSIKRFKRRISHKLEQKYFSELEIKETLKPGEIFNPNQAPVSRPAYTYKNGSTYVGEWVNGFRHGRGWMLWADGAAYEGQWGHG